ncbi:MAG TPA: acyltransferase [Hyphomicrobiaceae bacterium]|nr:acyltransferase [Hyphomicrobiaceae bacterium]
MKPESAHIKRNDLQWLRALAALEVVVWHSDLATKHFSAMHIQTSIYTVLGGVGVELFFILSGYVICMQAPTYKTGAEFMVARIFRLLPLYWIFTSLVIAAYFLNPGWKLHGLELDPMFVVRSYLFLPQQKDPVLGLGWTLEHEMIFYAIVALALMFLAGASRQWKLIVAFILSGLGFLGFLLGTGPSKQLWDYQIASPYMLAFGFGWLMRVVDENGGARASGNPLILFLLLLMGALTVAGGADIVLFWRMALAGAVFVTFCKLRSYFERNTLINRAMGRIGDASYSLYLSHWFVLSIAGKVLDHLNVPAQVDLPVRLAAIVACMAVGYWIFLVIEKPIDRYLRGSGRQKRTLHAQQPPDPMSVPGKIATLRPPA